MSFLKSVCKTISNIATAPFKAMASIATGQNCFAKGPTIINNGGCCCGPRPYCGAHGPSVFGRGHCHCHHHHHHHRPMFPHHFHHRWC